MCPLRLQITSLSAYMTRDFQSSGRMFVVDAALRIVLLPLNITRQVCKSFLFIDDSVAEIITNLIYATSSRRGLVQNKLNDHIVYLSISTHIHIPPSTELRSFREGHSDRRYCSGHCQPSTCRSPHIRAPQGILLTSNSSSIATLSSLSLYIYIYIYM